MFRTFATLLVVSSAAVAAVYAQAPQLVSYYPMDDGSGTTVANAVNTAYNGSFASYTVGGGSWPLPTWTSGGAMFGNSAVQFTAQGPTTPGTQSGTNVNYVSCPLAGGAAGLASATISMWVEWNSNSQPVYVNSGGFSNGIYGSLLGYWSQVDTPDYTDWQPWDIGINASTNGAATSDPTQMAGLRVIPGYNPMNNYSNYSGTTTSDGGGTYGFPQSGTTAFTDPTLNTWHNIVITVAPAPWPANGGQGSLWSVYIDGTFLRSVDSPCATSGLMYAALEGDPTNGVSVYEQQPVTIGAMCSGAAVNGSNTTIEDVGVFNRNLDGDSSNSPSGTTPTNIGLIDAIYNLGISKLNYDLGDVSRLFTVYGNETGTATINGLKWTYATGLSGGLGVLQDVSGNFYVQLDGSGGGVEALAPVYVPGPGDANGDGRVDINDLTLVLTNFGKTGMTWSQGEFTGDGTVDINDLTIVLANFGTTYGSAGLAAVPEPSSFLLFGLAVVSLVAATCRRQREGGLSEETKGETGIWWGSPSFSGSHQMRPCAGSPLAG